MPPAMHDQKSHLQKLFEGGWVKPIEFEFARYLVDMEEKTDLQLLEMSAALLVRCTLAGDVCVLLEDWAEEPFLDSSEFREHTNMDQYYFPSVHEWSQELQQYAMVGRSGAFKPLILDHKNRLYLQRHWKYEQLLGHAILDKSSDKLVVENVEAISNILEKYFPSDDTAKAPEWQKMAAFLATIKDLVIITGGPGTGKTSTVVKILAVLLELEIKNETGQKRSRIALAAPTGKAAARLTQSMKEIKGEIAPPEHIVEAIPKKATTIHRLLGVRKYGVSTRYDRENRLPHDIVIVDEASMIDQALMSKLMEALKKDSKLILLGDKQQLASVETGSVLGDLTEPAGENYFSEKLIDKTASWGVSLDEDCVDVDPGPLTDHIVTLTHNYRFPADSGIQQLSEAIIDLDEQRALRILGEEQGNDVNFMDYTGEDGEKFKELLDQYVIEFYKELGSQNDPREMHEFFKKFRVLCAHRKGRFGVEWINRYIEDQLKKRWNIPPYRDWYRGKPLMITQNDYALGLHNGDIGIVDRTSHSNEQWEVCFLDDRGEIRRIASTRLNHAETVYASTVHKSQGSEYDQVILILPAETSEILTRELLYTALTRSRQSFQVWGPRPVLKKTIVTRIRRSSGLRDMLWSEDYNPSGEKDFPGSEQIELFGRPE